MGILWSSGSSWKCPECNRHNPVEQMECSKCECFRPAPPRMQEAKWYFSGDDGSWKGFASSDASSLEEEFSNNPTGESIVKLGPHGFPYSVSFARMEQRNINTGKVRSLKRDVSDHVDLGPYDNFSCLESLQQYCQDAGIKWLKKPYLLKLHEEGERLQRHQEIPEHGFFSVMEETQDSSRYYGYLDKGIADFLVISHPWMSMHHPDPSGVSLGHMYRSSTENEGMTTMRRFPMKVFIDFCCLPQRLLAVDGKVLVERTPDEFRCFRKALENMHVLYIHDLTVVLALDSAVPIDSPNPRAYGERGWCTFEYRVARMKCASHEFESVSDLTRRKKYARGESQSPPMAPEDFEVALQRMHFSNGRTDGETVSRLYAKVFNARVLCTKTFSFNHLGPSDMQQLAYVLPRFNNLLSVELAFCEFDAKAMRFLCRVLRMSELPELRHCSFMCCKCENEDIRNGSKLANELQDACAFRVGLELSFSHLSII